MPKSRQPETAPQTRQAAPAQVPADTSDQALMGNAAVQASLAGSTKQTQADADREFIRNRAAVAPLDVGKGGSGRLASDTKLVDDTKLAQSKKLAADTKLAGDDTKLAQTARRRAPATKGAADPQRPTAPGIRWPKDPSTVTQEMRELVESGQATWVEYDAEVGFIRYGGGKE